MFALFSDAPTIVSDSLATRAWAERTGLCWLSFAEASRVFPTEAVMVVHDWTGFRSKRADLQAASAGSRVLTVAVAAFDPSDEVTAYTLDLLARSDVSAATQQTSLIADTMRHADEAVRFVGPDCDLTWSLAREVPVGFRADTTMTAGKWHSVGEYFEVEIEAVGDAVAPYVLSGTARVRGLLAARFSTFPVGLESDFAYAQDMARAVAGSAEGVAVTLDNNRLVRAECGGEDLLPALRRLTNPVYCESIVEVAAGTNCLDPSLLRWELNSQINEGVQGMHFALGDGKTGVHVDFIVPGAAMVADNGYVPESLGHVA